MNNSFFAAIWAFIKSNRYAVVFTLVGIVLAVLFISIGFWRTVLILLLAAAGCAAGIFLDGRMRRGNKEDPFNFG
ncbi:MAG: DUF2273 domain-containing protein [Christensenellales bacterium]